MATRVVYNTVHIYLVKCHGFYYLSLVPKVNVVTIQNRPPLDAQKQYLSLIVEVTGLLKCGYY